MDRSHRVQAVQALNPAPWFWHLKMEGAPLDQFYGSSRGKVSSRRLLRAPPPSSPGEASPSPSFPTAPRRIKTAISLRSSRAPALEPPLAPTNSCRSETDQSSGASRPRIRRLRNGGLTADELVWTDRFLQGLRPSRCQGHPSFALLQPGIPPLTAHTPVLADGQGFMRACSLA